MFLALFPLQPIQIHAAMLFIVLSNTVIEQEISKYDIIIKLTLLGMLDSYFTLREWNKQCYKWEDVSNKLTVINSVWKYQSVRFTIWCMLW